MVAEIRKVGDRDFDFSGRIKINEKDVVVSPDGFRDIFGRLTRMNIDGCAPIEILEVCHGKSRPLAKVSKVKFARDSTSPVVSVEARRRFGIDFYSVIDGNGIRRNTNSISLGIDHFIDGVKKKVGHKSILKV